MLQSPGNNGGARKDAMRNWVIVPIVTSLLITVIAVALLLANR